MKIAVLSGKGGTGKTFLAVNLAWVAGESVYVDCDIEEPNGHLYFKPEWDEEKKIGVDLPNVDREICTGCRMCVEFCKFNALAYIKDRVFVFDKVCHSCGGCKMICPVQAINYRNKAIGKIRKGMSGSVQVISGMLDVGEMTGTPLIKEMISEIRDKKTDVIIDCPPGSACIVMDSIKEADYCVLVAEPTVFGRHNLEMVYELVNIIGKRFGIVLNKHIIGDDPSEKFCLERNIEILARIPFDLKIGQINSDGKIIASISDEYKKIFVDIMTKIRGEIK
jgi:MinD superfamily P-loop ATPase